MTVLSPVTRSVYVSDGVTKVFDTGFAFQANADVDLRIVYPDNSVEVPTTGFTVAGAGNPAGGTITLAVARAAGAKIVIDRDTPHTQPVVYTYNDLFPAKTHEAALDRLTMITQEIQADLDEISGKVVPILPLEFQGLIVRWRGQWTAGADYTYGDTVSVATEEGSIYVCTTPHHAAGAFDATKWSLMLDQTGINAAIDQAEAAADAATAAQTAADAAAASATSAASAATAAGDQAADAQAAAEAAQATATAAASAADAASDAAADAALAANAAANKIPTPIPPADAGKIVQVDPSGASYQLAGLSGVSVTSVFGRAAAVVAQAGDYPAIFVTEDTDGNVQAALVAIRAALASGLAGTQPLDAMLTALAALVTANNKGLMFTGADAPATYDLSAFARTVLDDANATAALATLTAAGLALANTFTALQTIDLPSGTREALTVIARNAAANGLVVGLGHLRNGPAANDSLLTVAARGNDANNAVNDYGYLIHRLLNPAAAAKASEWALQARVANALVENFRVGNGVALTAALGMMGAGTINAAEFYRNGVALAIGSGIQKAPRFHIAHTAASGTNGGSNGTANTWTKTTLNTVVRDDIGITPSSSVLPLPAGTYIAQWALNAAQCDNFASRLWNVSDGTMIQRGGNGDAASGQDDKPSIGHSVFTLAATKNVQLERRATFSNTTTGMGAPLSDGVGEFWTQLILDKVA